MRSLKRNVSHRRSKSRRSGFTLMEVLIVMAILVIMGALVITNFTEVFGSAKKKSAKIQLQAIGKALKLYQIDMNSYPDPNQGLFALQDPPTDLASTSWSGPYLEKNVPADPWGNPYNYALDFDENDRQFFIIWSIGPNMQDEDGSGDDIVEYSNQ